jgi:hypothetical protein
VDTRGYRCQPVLPSTFLPGPVLVGHGGLSLLQSLIVGIQQPLRRTISGRSLGRRRSGGPAFGSVV